MSAIPKVFADFLERLLGNAENPDPYNEAERADLDGRALAISDQAGRDDSEIPLGKRQY